VISVIMLNLHSHPSVWCQRAPFSCSWAGGSGGGEDRDGPSNPVDLVFSCLACGTVALEMHEGKGDNAVSVKQG